MKYRDSTVKTSKTLMYLCKIFTLLLILSVIACNQSAKSNDNASHRQQATPDSATLIEATQRLEIFNADTSRKDILKYCDSIFYAVHKQNAQSHLALVGLRTTRAYLHDYDFLINEVYPELFKGDVLYERFYENVQIHIKTRDTAAYCDDLRKTEVLLSQKDLQNDSSIAVLLVYTDVINKLYGNDVARAYLRQNISGRQSPEKGKYIIDLAEKVIQAQRLCECRQGKVQRG